MAQRIRIERHDIEVVSVNGAARYLDIPACEIEHWIANNLLTAVYRDHDGDDYKYLLDTDMIRELKTYIDHCPQHWSHERMMWYRYITVHMDEMQEDLAVYGQFLSNKERIHHYNTKRRTKRI